MNSFTDWLITPSFSRAFVLASGAAVFAAFVLAYMTVVFAKFMLGML